MNMQANLEDSPILFHQHNQLQAHNQV